MKVFSVGGTDFEEECVGVSSRCHRRRKIKSVTFFDAIEIAKHSRVVPGWCPDCPKKRITKALYDRVASLLGRDKKSLKLYVAIQTVMDSMYGVDLFFEYKGAVVTVDLTVSPSKCKARADFVLSRKDVVGDAGFYRKADAIAKALKGGWLEDSQFMTESSKIFSKILTQHLHFLVRVGTFKSKREFNILDLLLALFKEIHLLSQGK